MSKNEDEMSAPKYWTKPEEDSLSDHTVKMPDTFKFTGELDEDVESGVTASVTGVIRSKASSGFSASNLKKMEMVTRQIRKLGDHVKASGTKEQVQTQVKTALHIATNLKLLSGMSNKDLPSEVGYQLVVQLVEGVRTI